MVFDRTFPAGAMARYARSAESLGLDQLWVIEDCFYTAGVSLAAAALSVTERVQVGLGILPAVARPAAVTAMELATLADIAPGRLVAGLGHGVQDWMAQMGVRPRSPLTAFDETMTNVRRLLCGDEVTFHGEYVHLDRVRLDRPPTVAVPLFAGMQQERSMALAGRVADGVILVEGVGATYVRWSLEQCGRDAGTFDVATFSLLSVDADRRVARERVAPFVAGLVRDRRRALTVLPFFGEMVERLDRDGPSSLVDMPNEQWCEIGAVGTFDDALAHVDALERAGATSINIYPGPSLEEAFESMVLAGRLCGR
jgi:alkanesulfonate monooxygenase SsuD/methylene tetrahydromethanopterin reductase-like flavin-dependent oxidoreductase (luciferase family)